MSENSVPKKEHVFALDFIRAFAIICVICVHFLFNTSFYDEFIGNYNWLIYCISRALFIVGVPLFLLLSGYLLNNKEPDRKYYSKLFYIIGIYLIVSVMTAFWNVFVLHEPFSLSKFINGILEFNFIRYGWYVKMYIGLFFLAPFLNILWKNLPAKKYKNALVGSLFFVTVLPTIWGEPYLLPNYWIAAYPLFFYFAGVWFKEFELSISKNLSFWLFVLAFVSFGCFDFLYCYGHTFRRILPIVDSGHFQAAVTALLAFNWFLKIDYDRWFKCFKRLVSVIAKYTYAIYLCSYMADKLVYGYLNTHTAGIMTDKLIYYLPTVLVVFLISFALAFCAEKLLYCCIIKKAFKSVKHTA